MTQAAATVRPPLWRNVRVLRVAGQIAFTVAIAIVLREMFLNASFALADRGRDLSYSYLDNRAGFNIKETILNYSANQPFYRAFLAGATNAILVAVVGIKLPTIVGLFLGGAGLSPNWLLRRIAQVYVEVFRNTPLLVQVIFWYVAVILAVPTIDKSVSVFGLAFVSNRGAAIPAVRPDNGFGIWVLIVAAGIAGGVIAWRWRTRVNEESG